MFKFLCEPVSLQLAPRSSAQFSVLNSQMGLAEFDLGIPDGDRLFVYIISEEQCREYRKYFWQTDFDGPIDKLGFFSRNMDGDRHYFHVVADEALFDKIHSLWAAMVGEKLLLSLSVTLGPVENEGEISEQRGFVFSPDVAVVV
jgi:hypothetical protein